MRKVKAISYNPIRDQEVIDHVEKQQNASKYILDLVRRDMESSNLDEYIDKRIEEHLEKMAEKIKNPNRT